MEPVAELPNVVVALDYTPNTNHVGFYLAKALGYYAEVGISVQLRSPHLDSYAASPASQVTCKSAMFALAPADTVISHHLPPERPKLVAVASIVQEDLSLFVALKSSGITRPKHLDGKSYASYAARFEGRIVQRLIQADGGTGDYVETTPDKLGIWNTLVSGQADATWIFKGWEGVEADLMRVELNEFRLADYGIPYLPSPMVIVHPDTLRDQEDVVRRFLRASGKGFTFAVHDLPKSAVMFTEIAIRENPGLPDALDAGMVLKSLEIMCRHYLDSRGCWGGLAREKWEKFIDWLGNEGLLSSYIHSRTPVPGVSVSLDDLRKGNVGEVFPSSTLDVANLATNAYLPL